MAQTPAALGAQGRALASSFSPALPTHLFLLLCCACDPAGRRCCESSSCRSGGPLSGLPVSTTGSCQELEPLSWQQMLTVLPSFAMQWLRQLRRRCLTLSCVAWKQLTRVRTVGGKHKAVTAAAPCCYKWSPSLPGRAEHPAFQRETEEAGTQGKIHSLRTPATGSGRGLASLAKKQQAWGSKFILPLLSACVAQRLLPPHSEALLFRPEGV